MIIFIGSDHRGFEAKEHLKNYLESIGKVFEDTGDDRYEPEDDFPQFAGHCVTSMLASTDPDVRGILICGSGQGMCMAANRFKGIRAALGHDVDAARSARNDDDANVLCLPAELVETGDWQSIVTAFLESPFAAAPRFIRRIKELDDLG